MASKIGIDVRVIPRTKIILNKEGEDVIVPNKSDLENCGRGNYFPYRPACHHNGKTAMCVTFALKGGGITAEIWV